MRYLITPSLLNSWLFLLNCPESYEKKAKDSFLLDLNRTEKQTTEAMQLGIDFENDIKKACNELFSGNEFDTYTKCVKEVAEIVKNGQWQIKVYKDMKINDIDFFLYGKVDVLKDMFAYDIKFTENYDPGKYFESTQHSLYLECLNTVPYFKYLISDGNEVYHEDFRKAELTSIGNTISEFISWLPEDWKQIYFSKWESNYENKNKM